MAGKWNGMDQMVISNIPCDSSCPYAILLLLATVSGDVSENYLTPINGPFIPSIMLQRELDTDESLPVEETTRFRFIEKLTAVRQINHCFPWM
jgi:hypothetical protein